MPGFYQRPERLLDTLGVTEPPEIDVDAIAQYCNATVVYEPLVGCAARLLGYGDRAIITVHHESSAARRRFSAAHELGHWMRDRHRIASYRCGRALFRLAWSVDDPEHRANRYAAELLLPEAMFKPRARGLPATFETVRELAKIFVTSLTATAIRLVEIGPWPAMLICSAKDRRKWFAKGPDVNLWPKERVGPATVAADLLHNPSALEPGPTEACADGWIEHGDASRYAVIEDSRRMTSDLVLSLLWWKDETELLELEVDSSP